MTVITHENAAAVRANYSLESAGLRCATFTAKFWTVHEPRHVTWSTVPRSWTPFSTRPLPSRARWTNAALAT